MKQKSDTGKELSGLWKQYKAEGRAEAKEAIIVAFLPLVRVIAGRMALNAPPQVDEDDLIGWGILGLIDSVERFDPEQNVSFETYASLRIRGAIIDEIRSLDWAPRSLRQKARKLSQASAELREATGREPTESELADKLGMDADELFALRTEIHGAYVLSLDAAMLSRSQADETTLADITSDSNASPADESLAKREMEDCLVKLIADLSDIERHVITLYYYDELTLKEIGEALELSESRICQIHRAVIKKLKNQVGVGLKNAIP